MADSPGALATSTTADAVQLVDAVLEAETAAGSEVEANVVLPAPAPTQPELELQLEEKLEEDVPPSCSPAPGHSNTAPQVSQPGNMCTPHCVKHVCRCALQATSTRPAGM
jgi:hypothetical protein